MNTLQRLSYSLVATVALAACAETPEEVATPTPSSALELALEAAGGADALSALEAFEVTASGEMWFFGEGVQPELVDEQRGTFDMVMTVDVANDRLATAWDRLVDNFGVEMPLVYDEIIDGDLGTVVGCDSVFGLCTGQMRPNRVAAIGKNVRLFNPHVLLRRAIDEPSTATNLDDEVIGGRTYRVVALDDHPRPIRIYVDAESGEIARAVTTEVEPILGDTEVVVTFSGWTTADAGLRFPTEAVATSSGLKVTVERNRSIHVHAADDAIFAATQGLDAHADEHLADWGSTHGQWLHRSACAGVPFDGDQVTVQVVDLLEGTGMSGVYLFAGSHNTLLVEHDDGLILIEAPLHERRMDAVLAEVRKLYPSTPITHVVSTHHHYDHTGGLRRALAEGTPTLVVSEQGRAFYERLLAAPFTVHPDALSATGREVTIQTVPDQGSVTIGSGMFAIEVHDFDTTHANDMVVTYLPALKQLFQSDLYFYFATPDGTVFPLVAPFTNYAAPMVAEVGRMGLDVDWVLGGHGFPVDWGTAVQHIESAAVTTP